MTIGLGLMRLMNFGLIQPIIFNISPETAFQTICSSKSCRGNVGN